MRAQLTLRGQDSWGSGAYKASRGSRTHNGIDYAAAPGTAILSPVAGRVTKLGYPYANDLSYRYVQLTAKDSRLLYRVFYIFPAVGLEDFVDRDCVIGYAQDIAARYDSRMTNHIHFEIKDAAGVYYHPED